VQGGVVATVGVGELFAAIEQEDFFHGNLCKGKSDSMPAG
jgi:hypothetical protein